MVGGPSRSSIPILLVVSLLAAGCVTPAEDAEATLADAVVDAPAHALTQTLSHADCTLQIAFFKVPEDAARERMPAGFEPVLEETPTGPMARSFVVAYGCQSATDGTFSTGGVSEMGFALAVEPPEALRSERASTHWVGSWVTSSPEVATLYEAWGLGTLGDVTLDATTAGAGAGAYTTTAVLDGARHTLTTRGTGGALDLAEDTLRVFTVRDGQALLGLDLTVVATKAGTGVATYEGTEGFYPLTKAEDAGYHEFFTGKAWTFTPFELPGSPSTGSG